MGALLAGAAFGSPAKIRPGEVWPDDRGVPIQAHGGAVLREGDAFYWFGEDRTPHLDPARRYVSCYASADLVHWTFRNRVLQLAAPAGFTGRWILERPKVFHNPKTGKYVMYMHLDGPVAGEEGGYRMARVGVAVADRIDGDYAFLRSFRPLGHESRDIGQFVDDDGSAYLIFEDRPFGFRIAALSQDYLDVERQVCLVPRHLEGGALVHYEGSYYFVGSELTSWKPNPNVYSTAPSLAGPWSEFRDIAPPKTNTYGSQSTFLLKIAGTRKTTVVFLGDRWKPKALWDSRYLWMPLEIGHDTLRLPPPRPWSIDARTGETD